MDAHLPESFLDGTDGECIIKVLGIMRIYGKGYHITEILTAGQCGISNLR